MTEFKFEVNFNVKEEARKNKIVSATVVETGKDLNQLREFAGKLEKRIIVIQSNMMLSDS